MILPICALPIGCTQRKEGIAAIRPSAHMPLRNAKASLRNSKKPAAGLAGGFVISESQNLLTQREKSSDFS